VPKKPTGTIVVYHPEAVDDFQGIKDKQARKKVLTIVSILRQAGTSITEPHVKKVQGEAKLYELRPGGGKTLLRPLYAQIDAYLVILAIGPKAEVNASGFAAAVKRAKRRAKEEFGVEI
jgi:hypothetical protein